MTPVVKINEDLKQLFSKVREERKAHKACLSAQDGISVKDCLQEIIDRDVYKKDYESITMPLIFEKVGYAEDKAALQKIVNGELFL